MSQELFLGGLGVPGMVKKEPQDAFHHIFILVCTNTMEGQNGLLIHSLIYGYGNSRIETQLNKRKNYWNYVDFSV